MKSTFAMAFRHNQRFPRNDGPRGMRFPGGPDPNNISPGPIRPGSPFMPQNHPFQGPGMVPPGNIRLPINPMPVPNLRLFNPNSAPPGIPVFDQMGAIPGPRQSIPRPENFQTPLPGPGPNAGGSIPGMFMGGSPNIIPNVGGPLQQFPGNLNMQIPPGHGQMGLIDPRATPPPLPGLQNINQQVHGFPSSLSPSDSSGHSNYSNKRKQGYQKQSPESRRYDRDDRPRSRDSSRTRDDRRTDKRSDTKRNSDRDSRDFRRRSPSGSSRGSMSISRSQSRDREDYREPYRDQRKRIRDDAADSSRVLFNCCT